MYILLPGQIVGNEEPEQTNILKYNQIGSRHFSA
jgi:hypothetical protein